MNLKVMFAAILLNTKYKQMLLETIEPEDKKFLLQDINKIK
jgi:hypothetical protein